MTTLALRLAGPLQAWGTRSRHTRRDTETAPTKSGVLGLFAAARGVRRTDPFPDDLLALRFGVRVDDPGVSLRDFQTARRLDGTALPLSHRRYLADAVFLAVVEGPEGVIRRIAADLLRPVFPLYLGRRSCPPAGPLVGEIDSVEGAGLAEVLEGRDWTVNERRARRQPSVVEVEIVRDVLPRDAPDSRIDVVQDVPISLDPEHRRHDWRRVVRYPHEVTNPHAVLTAATPAHVPAPFGD